MCAPLGLSGSWHCCIVCRMAHGASCRPVIQKLNGRSQPSTHAVSRGPNGTLSASSTGADQPMSDADLAAVARIAEIGGTGFEHRPVLAKLDRSVPLP